jgi:hypothetical protein
LTFKPAVEAADAPFDDEGVKTVAWSSGPSVTPMDAASHIR